MPRLILTFPPFTGATSPPLGVCALKGHLKRTNPDWDVSVEDLNLRTHTALIHAVRTGGRLNPQVFPNGALDEAALLRADEVFHGLHSDEFYCNSDRYTLYGDIMLRLFESEMQSSFLIEDTLKKNAPLPPFIYQCADFLLARQPDAIGLSVCYSQQAWFSIALGKALRERSECPIFYGGTFFLNDIERFLRALGPVVTAVISGEGEKAMESLLKAGCNPEGVPGAHYIRGERYHGSEAELSGDLSSSGHSDFSDLSLRAYFSPEPVIPVLTSRGCYWRKCAFCTHYKSAGMTYRCRPLDDVMEEIKNHIAAGFSNFALIDEMIPPARFRQISEEILRNKLSINFYALAKPEKGFTREIFDLARSAGLRYLLWGVESGSQRVLDLMQKGTTVEEVSRVLRNAHDAGIRNHCYVIIGFPTETRAEAYETMQFLEDNRNYISQIHRGTFTLDETSPVAVNPAAYGITSMWQRTESLVPRPLGYESPLGMSQDDARKVFSSFLPFLRAFNPYSRCLGSYRDHALLIYSKRGEELDMEGRSFPPWRGTFPSGT